MAEEPTSRRHWWSNIIILPLIVNVVAGLIVFYGTGNPVWAGVGFGSALVTWFAIYRLVNWLASRHLESVSISRIVPYAVDRTPLDVVPINTRIDGLASEFFFMGVSGKSLWDSDLFNLMERGYACKFRFLLLNPNGVALRRHVEREHTSSQEAVRHDIEAFQQHLVEIKRRSPDAHIELAFYDFLPSLWLMRCDTLLYCQTFPPGRIGQNSPLLILREEHAGRYGFFEPLVTWFDEIWQHHAVRVSIGKGPSLAPTKGQ